MLGVKIRLAQFSDISSMTAILNASHIPWSNTIIEDCFNMNDHLWVLCVDNLVVALLIVRRIANDVWEILQIAVDQAHLRQGYASKLLNFLVEKAKKQSVCKIELEVRASNQAAIALYQKFDFEVEGVRKQYYQDSEDALLMGLRI